jgi:hypothetical protein
MAFNNRINLLKENIAGIALNYCNTIFISSQLIEINSSKATQD